jgi:hypothetical protein
MVDCAVSARSCLWLDGTHVFPDVDAENRDVRCVMTLSECDSGML